MVYSVSQAFGEVGVRDVDLGIPMELGYVVLRKHPLELGYVVLCHGMNY